MVERTAHNGLVVGSIPTKPKLIIKLTFIMELNFKNYKIIKATTYIKKNNLFFFFGGANRNSNDWLTIEQNLKNINFNYHKIFNKTSKKILNSSIYKNTKETINGITFLIKPKNKKLLKQVLITNFEPLLFNMLAIKINNKMYQTTQLKNNYSLNYIHNKQLILQFRITNLKKSK